MTLIVDANALLALADLDDPRHASIRRVILAERETLATSELIVAEADYLILRRLGVDAELAFLKDLADGALVVDCLNRQEIRAASEVVRQHRDLRLGLADASLIVLAQRHHTRRILTYDHRAFRIATPLQGGTFTLLPADG